MSKKLTNMESVTCQLYFNRPWVSAKVLVKKTGLALGDVMAELDNMRLQGGLLQASLNGENVYCQKAGKVNCLQVKTGQK